MLSVKYFVLNSFERPLLLICGSVLLLLLILFKYREAPENGFHLDDSRNIYRYPPVMVNASMRRLLAWLHAGPNIHRFLPGEEGKSSHPHNRHRFRPFPILCLFPTWRGCLWM